MVRLRKATGNNNLKTQAEIDVADRTAGDIVKETLWRPFAMFFEPTLLVYNAYLALIYGAYYRSMHPPLIPRTSLYLVRVLPARLCRGARLQPRRVRTRIHGHLRRRLAVLWRLLHLHPQISGTDLRRERRDHPVSRDSAVPRSDCRHLHSHRDVRLRLDRAVRICTLDCTNNPDELFRYWRVHPVSVHLCLLWVRAVL